MGPVRSTRGKRLHRREDTDTISRRMRADVIACVNAPKCETFEATMRGI